MFWNKEEQLINIRFAELHNGLILGGKNFKERLDPIAVEGLRVLLQDSKDRLIITYNGDVSLMPLTNVKHKVLYKEDADEIMKLLNAAPKPKPTASEQIKHNASHPHLAGISHAQVETPMSHVHAGHGHGQTGQKPIGKA